MSTWELPLFPLGVVLLPGSALPLHIFEERYRLLVGRSAETGEEFGINLVDTKGISSVGCTAVVREVVRRYENGSFDVVVEGRRRYQLLEVRSDQAPYYIGNAVLRKDADEEADRELVRITVTLYNRLITVVFNDERLLIREGTTPGRYSFRMAQKAGLDLAMRQHLLEVDSENQRLGLLRTYLEECIPRLENAAEVDRIARNDGYVP